MKKKLLALLIISQIYPSTVSFAADVAISHSEEYLMQLWVNGVDQQRDVIFKKTEHSIWVACVDLDGTFIDIAQLKQQTIQNTLYCDVNHAGLTSQIDDSSQTLQINLPASGLSSNQVLNKYQGYITTPAPFGAYLDYEAYYAKHARQADNSMLNIRNELGVFWKNALFTHAMLTKREEFNQQENRDTTRLFSNLSIEYPQHMSTLQFGDITTASTANTRGFYFAGVQYGTNFISRPGFVYWNVPQIQGSALTPSTVDLYINGVRSYNSRVNPGEFNIESGAFLNGDGTAQLVVEDILGNRQVQNIELFVSDRLLRPNLADYQFSAGKIRYNYDQDSDDYRESFASAYYRKGMTSKWSLGGTIQYSDDIQNAGLLSTHYIRHFGVLDLGAGWSHADASSGYSRDGHTLSIGFEKNTARYNIGANTQFYSQDYQMLGMEQGAEVSERESLAYIGFNQVPFFGNISLNYIERIPHKNSNTEESQIFAIRGGRALSRNLYFNYGVQHERHTEDDVSFDLALTYQFDEKRSAYLNHDQDATTLNFTKADAEHVGIDYDIGVAKLHGTTASQGNASDDYAANAQTRLKSNLGDLTLKYYQSEQRRNYQANFKGALTWLGGAFNFTKAVDYPFSLIRIEDSPNIDVFRNNTFIGKTNKNGTLFVHRLIPYTQQVLSFNPNQLEIEDQVSTTKQTLVPLPSRGYVLDFPVVKTREITFRIVAEDGKEIPVGSLLSVDQNGLDLSPVGKAGLVTLYGIIPNINHAFSVQTGVDSQCHFQHQTAQSTSLDIGQVIEVTCLTGAGK
ncbi:outer membrane usher protein [Acinetobacter marinus]|uniref:Outer membrane usher protein n=1 Tax=Acinetobacter marinus TaxID=281375 RepID=A0A1G6JVE0_9GAMM|nr:fimbria/pilus outer membrane usher protein [Acinetobacter marinus]SDC22712.1 outer membrane usher protein [Acinetobacter marinus]